MDVIEAIRSRKSIRGYKLEPVPKEILREILEVAMRTPSTLNTQPWEITVVTGKALDEIKAENIVKLNAGIPPQPETPFKPYEGKYKQRQVELAIDLFKLMGITREDKAKRAEWLARGFYFFGAPATIIISLDKSLIGSDLNLLDIGALTQTICLAALKYGLGTCINDQGISYPEVIRKYTSIPQSKQMIICIAIGYPDWDFPANKLISKREPVDSVTTWCGDL